MSLRGRVVAGVIAAAMGLGFVPGIVPPTTSVLACSAGYYENVDSQCIPVPQQPVPGGGVPPGATAVCDDGSYSFSTHRSGTCSGHGGVGQWL